METSIPSILQINLYLILLYSIYAVFLRKETHFKLSRYYLLVGSLLAILIPFIELPESASETVNATGLPDVAIGIFDATQLGNAPQQETNQFFIIIASIYIVGVIILFSRFLLGLWGIKSLIKQSKTIREKGYWFVKTPKAQKPFSFLNYLFWDNPSHLSDTEYQQIKAHELTHIRQWHSIDIIIFELIQILFWYNPVCLFYKKSIRTTHEYLADASIVAKTLNHTSYSELLLGQFFQSDKVYLTSQFLNKSILKNRIMMLHQVKSRKATMLKVFWAIPIIILCFFINACQDKFYEPLNTEAKTYKSIKTYNLPAEHEIRYTMVLSKGTAYRFKTTDTHKGMTYSIVDSEDIPVATNIAEKPYSHLYFTAPKTGIYKLIVNGNNQVLEGKIDLSFWRKEVKDLRNEDGLPDGFTTYKKYNIGEQNEVTMSVGTFIANTNIVFKIDVPNDDINGVQLNIYSNTGSLIGRNKLGDKYYNEVTVKIREEQELSFKITQTGTPKKVAVTVGSRLGKSVSND